MTPATWPSAHIWDLSIRALDAQANVPSADLADALRRALADAPAVIDVVALQDAVSSNAHKELGLVPDYRALTAWDKTECRRHGLE